ncbi:glycoside hydrolase family 18 protein [Robertmurraya sp. Marseille-Q9965]
MKKRTILLSLVILITFIGGFYTGTLFTAQDKTEITNIGKLPQSNKETQQKIVPKVTQEKVLIGYVQDYRDPNKIPYDQLTHVIFSFAHPTKDGQLLFNGEQPVSNLRTITAKAHATNTKVILAIGGWYHIQGGESYSYFKEAISSPNTRQKLVQEINRIVQKEKLDGIDIDFEHPRSKEDAQYLAAFVEELRSVLKDKEISIAVNAKVHSVAGTEINNVIYETSMFENVDHVNIMAYDGQWDGEYNAANLSPYKFNEQIVKYWTNLFETNQLPKDKLVLGIPSYGQPEDPNIKQVSYSAIINANPANASNDTVALNGTTYHYNGINTVQKKVNLALQNGLGGMMLWEVGLDAEGSNSLSSVIAKKIVSNDLYTLK